MRQPLHSSMLMRSMARKVARVGYAAAEMAENWENECNEGLDENEKLEGRERMGKVLRH